MYPIDRYKFFTQETPCGTKTIAVTTYAGKTVRGTAICHPNDTFDEELGKKIAAARCAVKVAEKRLRRAEDKFHDAFCTVESAKVYEDKMWTYRADAMSELDNAENHLNSLLNG